MTDTVTPIGAALGRLPMGLFLVTTADGPTPVGFVGSLLTQVGFEPPTVCVAIAKGRDHLMKIREHGSFAVSILDDESRHLMGNFFRKFEPGESPFDGLDTEPAPNGCPIFRQALAWVECRAVGEHSTGDHIVVFGEVTAGAKLRDADPSLHVRKDGLGY